MTENGTAGCVGGPVFIGLYMIRKTERFPGRRVPQEHADNHFLKKPQSALDISGKSMYNVIVNMYK